MVAVDLDYVSRGNSKRIQKQTRVMSFMHFCMCFVCLFEQLFHLSCFLCLDVHVELIEAIFVFLSVLLL